MTRRTFPGYEAIADAIDTVLDVACMDLTITHDGQPVETYNLARCLDKAGLIDWAAFPDPKWLENHALTARVGARRRAAVPRTGGPHMIVNLDGGAFALPDGASARAAVELLNTEVAIDFFAEPHAVTALIEAVHNHLYLPSDLTADQLVGAYGMVVRDLQDLAERDEEEEA